jgi:uncharacterized protein YacL
MELKILSILNGCLLSDIIIIGLTMSRIIRSNYLVKWYQSLRLSAVIMDTLILVIGILIAEYLYPFIFSQFNFILFLLLVLCIQIIHDILFYFFFSQFSPKQSFIMDLFQKYAVESSWKAILGDSIMIILATLFSFMFQRFSQKNNLIFLIVMVYVTPFFLYIQ